MSAIVDRINTFVRKCPTWPVYVLLTLPIPYYFYLAINGHMGVEPINALERKIGEIGLQIIIAGLTISPLCRHARLSIMKFRRSLGVMAFVYVFVHFSFWIVLDMNLRWSQMWGDIWRRPYIAIGMAAFVLLIPLILTSSDRAIRKLGPMRWRRLHKLAYPVAVLGAVHYIMVQKVWELEPMIYLAVVIGLLALRYKRPRKPNGIAAKSN